MTAIMPEYTFALTGVHSLLLQKIAKRENVTERAFVERLVRNTLSANARMEYMRRGFGKIEEAAIFAEMEKPNSVMFS